MPTIDDLQEKLNIAQEKFNNIVNELSSFSTLKKTLDSSDKGIKDAATNLDALTKVLETSVNALNQSADALKDTIESLKKTDPVVINRNLSKILEESKNTSKSIEGIENSSQKIIDIVDQLNSSSTIEIKKLQDKIDDLDKKLDENKEMLEKVQKKKGIIF